MSALTSAQLTRQSFDTEMQSFFLLFNRYLTEKAKGEKLYVISGFTGWVTADVK